MLNGVSWTILVFGESSFKVDNDISDFSFLSFIDADIDGLYMQNVFIRCNKFYVLVEALEYRCHRMQTQVECFTLL